MERKVFTPVTIGGMELRNRIVMPGLTSNYASSAGEVTDQLIAYLSERAKGGVGLILVESAFTDLSGKGTPNQVGIHDDTMIPGLRRLTNALYQYGTKAGIQIMHCGRQMTSQFSGTQSVGPSSLSCPVVNIIPRELSIAEIEDQIERFALAASRAVAAGFDCIEFVASHGYLISNFLSAYSNKRDDEYGGDFEGRFRFLRNIILRSKALIGDFPILVRINAAEYVENGIEIEEAKRIAVELEQLGVHAIDVSVSVKASYHYLSASTGEPYANQAHLAEQIKRVVKIPVITAGRILDFATAEEILRNEQADLVAMGRALIADPQIVQKMQSGDEDEIIPCIGCNACNQRSRRPQIVCAVNSDTGREHQMEIIPAEIPKKVAVLGSGLPALEAARIAAMRGHQVTVFADESFGGLTLLRSLVPGMSEFNKPARYFWGLFQKIGVQVSNQQINQERLETEGYQVVLDGTWSYDREMGLLADKAVPAIEVLRGASTGHRVVVAGDGLLACEAALYLAHRGKAVTIVSGHEKKIRDAHPTVAYYLLERMEQAGVRFIDDTETANYDTVVVPHHFANDTRVTSRIPLIYLGDAYEASDLAEKVFKAGEVARTI